MEEEDRPVRVVFPRSRARGRGKDTPPAFLSFLGRISPCSLATPAITYRRVITARAPSLPPSFSPFCLPPSLGSVDTIVMAVRTAREIEYLPRQDAQSRIHSAIAARPSRRSRFFRVIPYASYRARIMVPLSLPRPFTNRRKSGVLVVRTDDGRTESGKVA